MANVTNLGPPDSSPKERTILKRQMLESSRWIIWFEFRKGTAVGSVGPYQAVSRFTFFPVQPPPPFSALAFSPGFSFLLL